MEPEFCPHHRCLDTCLAVARLLVQAGLLDVTPNAPVSAGLVLGHTAVPPMEVTLALLAHRVNVWGRVVIDPTLPCLDLEAVDERSLRYSLQALWEEISSGIIRMIGAVDSHLWWRVKEALGDAQSAASRTKTREDAANQALWWYIALLHLNQAHAVWKEHIGRPLSADPHFPRR